MAPRSPRVNASVNVQSKIAAYSACVRAGILLPTCAIGENGMQCIHHNKLTRLFRKEPPANNQDICLRITILSQ